MNNLILMMNFSVHVRSHDNCTVDNFALLSYIAEHIAHVAFVLYIYRTIRNLFILENINIILKLV